ncbi:hypothetical protein G4V39_07760 [Thermosulfuriphilus ammonigenes]|uniref:Uncharacterized protein n=1 Tax=Thermosulfuriphilus ammonigenes TaxID=1936021 RepID=A0A6G7PWV2_9BACT|nr:YkgJ family cysteine cluster protein [Thermosulfuriphilus ammonigenes]MBA2849739.1 Fe-S-cluster containining protein [Thermosulfuriphilus ammonigenes]QIJ72169.1 hypothetical protein G4V39_07760 [Thermosulfuriphilus ammonigenes]
MYSRRSSGIFSFLRELPPEISIPFGTLVREIDELVRGFNRRFPKEVRCRPGCQDCCYALFDVSYLEALVIREAARALKRDQRREIERRSRKALKALGCLEPISDPFKIAQKRVRCPLLGEDRLCLLYEVRPFTCRIYGLPVEIDGRARVCGFSGFEPGQKYPTIKWLSLKERLERVSIKLSPQLGRRRFTLAEVLLNL